MSFDRPRTSDEKPDQPSPTNYPQSRLAALTAHLKAHRFTADLTAKGVTVRNPEAPGCCPDNPVLSDTITCRRHALDADEWWFFDSAGRPIAEADRVTDALTHIKGALSLREEADH
ncbi:hypothetical protein [Spirillospora sp. CA-294931]|uniref:hypothetical protein n=1 Tax=Spirillospora sp. CA-294931 TaxID=3240042 RepID=UPI003D9318D5